MKFTILCMLSSGVLGLQQLYGQKITYKNTPEYLKANSNWLLGNLNRNTGHKSLNFNNGNVEVTALDQGTGQLEGRMIASHPVTGELLFYYNNSNRGSLYNKNQQLMLNGAIGDVRTASTRQGGVVIPVPGDTNRYYVVQLGQVGSSRDKKLKYHIMDMRLDGGLGGIIDTAKNISLEQYFIDSALNLSEGMVAVPGNNCDAWLILHEELGNLIYDPISSNKYFVFHITEGGIDSIPKVYQGNMGVPISGLLKVSPDRTRIVFVNQAQLVDGKSGSFEIVKFNPDNGEIFDPIQLRVAYDSFSPILVNFDMEFSDNSNLLYHIQLPTSDGKSTLTQYDISEHDSTKISSRIYQIVKDSTTDTNALGSLRLYDKKMYVTNSNRLGQIQYPDSMGAAMNYIDSFLILDTSSQALSYFSNELVFPMEKVVNIKNIEAYCDGVPLLQPIDSTASNYIWQDGTQGIAYEIPKSAIGQDAVYTVEYTIFYPVHNCIKWHIDSFYVDYKGLENEPIISVSGNQLSVAAIFDTYQWYLDDAVLNEETKNTLTVSKNGEYKIVVTKNGCEAESAPYKVNNATDITEYNNYDIEVYPNPTSGILFVRTVINEPLSFKLYDVMGKESTEYTIRQQGHLEWMLDMQLMPPGVYFLEIHNNDSGESQNVKVVKN